MKANQYPTEGAPPDFDRLARVYRWMEWASFGPILQKCRCSFLPAVDSARRALVIGDGDGRFTAELLRANQHIQIDAVDASPAMLAALLHHAGPQANRIQAFCADARHWMPPNPPYDLIVTHFFLDCLTREEIESLVTTIRAAVLPSAQWMISEFAIPHGVYGRFVARPLVAFLYWAFGKFTGLKVRSLSDHGVELRKSGFTLQQQHSRLGGLLVSQLWSS
jgi:SAM-dependent methyltransferase